MTCKTWLHAARWTLGLAGAACGSPSFDLHTDPIVSGSEDPDHEAVVALVMAPLSCGEPLVSVCTGTLIAPRVVLTAAHCLGLLPPDHAEIVVGRVVEATDARRIRIVKSLLHPHWVSPLHDVALVLLAEDAGIAPMRLIEPTDAWLPDGLLTLVGYGSDDRGQTGARRSGPARVFETTGEHFRVRPSPALSCAGDSGGPALAVLDGIERVVGVASYGDPTCAETATYARLDIELAGFVTPGLMQLQQPGDPAPLPEPSQCDVPSGGGCAIGPDSSGLGLAIVLALLIPARCRARRGPPRATPRRWRSARAGPRG